MSEKPVTRFLSFIEEGVFNPEYAGYVGGRIEVYDDNEEYAIDELRFLTKNIKGFYRFRDRWDFKDVTEKQLKYVEKRTKKDFLVAVV